MSSTDYGYGFLVITLLSFWHILCCTCFCASIGGVVVASQSTNSSVQTAAVCLVPLIGCCLWSSIILPGMPCYLFTPNCMGYLETGKQKKCNCYLSALSLV